MPIHISRKKDATFKGSALLEEESFRFKRAFHRFWLLYAVANCPTSVSIAKRTTMNVFRRLPDEELMELTEVWLFVTEMLECIFRLHHDMLYSCELIPLICIFIFCTRDLHSCQLRLAGQVTRMDCREIRGTSTRCCSGFAKRVRPNGDHTYKRSSFMSV